MSSDISSVLSRSFLTCMEYESDVMGLKENEQRGGYIDSEC